MRHIFLVFSGFFVIFMIQSVGRTIYIDRYEFEPARIEWEDAHKRGDQHDMRIAFKKEILAHARTIDPFWFLKKREDTE